MLTSTSHSEWVEEPVPVRVATILLVDHDEPERSRFRAALSNAGFRVFGARHAGEAQLICMKNEPIDLIVSHLMMPDVSGPEMIRTLASRLHECVRVLYLTREPSDRPLPDGAVDQLLVETSRQMVRGAQGVAKHLAIGPGAATRPHDGDVEAAELLNF